MKNLKMRYSGTVHAELLISRARLNRQLEEQDLIERRTMTLYSYLVKILPDELKDKIEFYFTDCGARYPQAFIYLVGDNEEEKKAATILLVEWLAGIDKWKFEKGFNTDTGKFSYTANRNIGKLFGNYEYVSYSIDIREAENIDGCTVTKKRKMRTVYETDCSNA